MDLSEIFRKCRKWQKLQVIQFYWEGGPKEILDSGSLWNFR